MTKRDIVKLALAHKPTPYTPWSFDFTHEAREKLEKHYGDCDLQNELGNHIIRVGCDLGFYENVGNDRFRDLFGVIWNRSIDKDIGDVEGEVLPEPSLDNYEFPNPRDERFFANINKRISKYPDCFRVYNVDFSLYERAWTLRGVTNLLMDFCENPDFVHELLGKITDFNITQLKKAVEYDIDAVYFGDDWGQQSSLIMGYKLWKKFIYPCLEKMYSAVKDSGKYVFIHSCGDVDELFDDLVDIKLDCFNPFQPEAMDCKSLYLKYRDKLSFWGGLSTQQTLPFGSVEEVKKETSELVKMGRNGSYILAPAHAVEGDVPLENMLAFINTVKEQV